MTGLYHECGYIIKVKPTTELPTIGRSALIRYDDHVDYLGGGLHFYLAGCRAYVRMALEIGSANREK
jgi:hypothetical protein